MKMAYFIQCVVSSIIFLFTAIATWYEGSEIRDRFWEWEYSAVFSKMINGKVTSEADIFILDHFVYAAKFKPFFPLLMTICFVYIVTLTVYYLLSYTTNKLIVFHWILGASSILISFLLSQSPTMGLKLFTLTFVIIGMLSMLASIFLTYKLKRKSKLSLVN